MENRRSAERLACTNVSTDTACTSATLPGTSMLWLMTPRACKLCLILPFWMKLLPNY